MTKTIYVEINGGVHSDFVERCSEIAERFPKLDFRCHLETNTELSSGLPSEIVAFGEHVATVLIPVIPFYLGRGRMVRISYGDKDFVFRGYKPSDIVELMAAVGSVSEEVGNYEESGEP